jgi:glycosyltransferase involved in cell wall biosynthesis
VQGPLAQCSAYLLARLSGNRAEADRLWTTLREPDVHVPPSSEAVAEVKPRASLLNQAKAAWSDLRRLISEPRVIPHRIARLCWRSLLMVMRRSGLDGAADRLTNVVGGAIWYVRICRIRFKRRAYFRYWKRLVDEYRTLFPKRKDKLTTIDAMMYVEFVDALRPVFAQYDIVQAYGIDPILPLVCGYTPYVALEHGTLREFIRQDNPVHRLTALAYRKAAHVFITNGDCLEHARWLGVQHYSAMLHPTDVDQHEARDEGEIAEIRRRYNADVLLFSPIRHDWAVKGTDIHIRALPLIRERIGGRFILLLVPWGLQVEDSKRLIAELGCEDVVAWAEQSFCRPALVRHMQAADVVLDQMALPHFGGTAPQSLAAGTPVIMSYRPESTAWLVDEPAPILPAFTPHEVADAVAQALDPEWRADFLPRARAWVHDHHHHDRLIREHLKIYSRILKSA